MSVILEWMSPREAGEAIFDEGIITGPIALDAAQAGRLFRALGNAMMALTPAERWGMFASLHPAIEDPTEARRELRRIYEILIEAGRPAMKREILVGRKQGQDTA